jgi:hypothetical protein
VDEQKPKSREEILAAIKAKADAIRAQRAAAQPPPTAAPEAPFQTPVSAVNVAGRPVGPPQNRHIRARATVTQGVELTAERTEDENIKRLLGGLGVYSNPVRGGVWQLDYRYYAEAKRRLLQAGYEIDEDQDGRVPLSSWTPHRGGWSKVED